MVSQFGRDPKGYYSMLGVSDDADVAAIKSAYRSKAKRMHPDINPSPIAAKQFQRLTEAYEVLSDENKRSKYDNKKPAAQSKAQPKSEKKTDAEPKPTSKPQHGTAKKPPPRESGKPNSQTKSKTQNTTKPDSGLKPDVCQCGKVTAQPRYVVFDMVAGLGRSTKRKEVAGIFCRTCADRAALKASFITWLTGWWAIPNGPKETVKALWNNIRGGRKPADRNTRLLVRQAKAFKDRGDLTLARGTAEQALAYAHTPELRREVDTLLLSLSAHSPKHLRTRWDKPGWAPVAQLMPVIAIVVWASLTVTMRTPVTLTDWVLSVVKSEDLATPGAVMQVRTGALNLRTGPGQDYQVLMILAKDAEVTVIEVSPGGTWVRVEAPDGTKGFVPLRTINSVARPQ
ncbi:MAG: DnaJ domain-containing protein [Alphaproteobacteria bacterium]|nr:DnaJ domain-containing protein [Alphaproteobacteria bacterium]